MPMSHRSLGEGAAALALAMLAACTTFAPGTLPPGTAIAQARQSLGGVAGEYRLADGGTRLEFRQGMYGKETYMLDFDASGRLVSSRQVLTPENFATIRPGLKRDEVLIRIGHPSYTVGVGYQHVQVWTYRFGGMEGDCVVFQVSISNASGAVSDAGPNTDPACSGGARSG
ncbi:MAG: hypothetical protein JO090_06290 [Rhizobacter sp.]|nr:hypothetical protein [Rhizobacter sp.]